MNKDYTLLFLGDVVPYKPFKFRNDLKAIINLECPIIKEGIPAGGKINLKVNENYLGDIFGNNLFCVNLGNNHIFDYGLDGLHSTLLEIEKQNAYYFGLNSHTDAKYEPLLIKLNNITIAFFSAVCQSTSPILQVSQSTRLSDLDVEALRQEISEVRPLVKRIVVYIHWGTEESSIPEPEEIEIARNLIDIGADIVVGSHAHAPQPVERYKKGIIAYNLGNFIMPDLRNIPTYYSGSGVAQSTYNKRTMLWNRLSWGLLIDMNSLDYKVMKYMFFYNRVVRLFLTPLDRYLKLNMRSTSKTERRHLTKHLRKRALYRRIIDFIYRPHIPDKLKRVL